ncbi:hypothetical protein BC628DRAFT_1384014 [Trametes gibbosa]|nr:hypothetical protein BC628DRAFT_1384014 [Trametes gibbosa]
MQPLRRAFSPISRLSDDLLYEIFEVILGQICFPGEADDAPYDPPSTTGKPTCVNAGNILAVWTAPIVLSHVCARWREFTLVAPRLWSFIRITGTFHNRMMLDAFIERSQDLPLSILFTKAAEADSVGDNVPSAQTIIFNFLAVATEVADHSARIHELGVVLGNEGASMVLEALSHSPIPALRKLWLDVGLEGNGDRRPIRMLNINPMSVRVLHARQMPLMWMPFEGLVRLELSSGPAPSLAALLFTLKSSPLLEVLQLRVPALMRIGDVPPEGVSPIPLSRLRELLLSVERYDSGAFEILAHISFPSTTEVDLHFTGCTSSCLYEHSPSLQCIAAVVTQARVCMQPNRSMTMEADDPYLSVQYDSVVCPEQSQRARLCEGFLAVPLPALEHLVLEFVEWLVDWTVYVAQEQIDMLFDEVHELVRLDTEVHPRYMEYIAAALAPRSAVREDVRCAKLRRWSILWCRRGPSVDEFWRVERCCAARAAAGVPFERLETNIPVPDLVMVSLQRSVAEIVVIDEV